MARINSEDGERMTHLDGTLEAMFNLEEFKDIKGWEMLDVGCRDAANKKVFEDRGCKWNGVDKFPADDLVKEMEMTELEYSDKTFDLVFVCHSLEHCEDPIKALREFRRVLKEGGHLFISLPCHCQHHILNSDNDHIFCLTDLQLGRLLIYSGFNKPITIITSHLGYDKPELFNLLGVVKR